MRTYASSRVKRKNFMEGKSELQIFLLIFILVDSFCPPIWRLHTKLYEGAWNVSANNSETVDHKDQRFGKIVYILVFYNLSFFWLFPLDGFYFIFLCRVYCVTGKTKNLEHHKTLFLVFFFSPTTIKEKIEFFILSKSLRFQVAG